MSYDCRAVLIHGFHVKIERVHMKVTRFNEEDGRPYEKSLYSHDSMILNGKEIASNKDDPDSFCSGEKILGLEIIRVGYESESSLVYLGHSISVEDHEVKEVTECPVDVVLFGIEYGVAPKTYFASNGG